jgi:hypothetical protein
VDHIETEQQRPQLLAPERALLTEVKVALSCVPTAVMVAMITTEMSAAISPYSMAVAPPSSERNLKYIDFMARSFPCSLSPRSPFLDRRTPCTSAACRTVKKQRKLLGPAVWGEARSTKVLESGKRATRREGPQAGSSANYAKAAGTLCWSARCP